VERRYTEVVSLAFASLLLVIPMAVTTPSPAADSFAFQLIARIPYYAVYNVTCGDGDHDGRQELVAYGPDRSPWVHIIEFNPDMSYETTGLGVDMAIAWFLSDLDRDGKSDLCVSRTNPYRIYLYESADSASLPLRLAWQEPVGFNTPHAVMTDFDSDSVREVTWQDNWVGGIRVFECVGDDSYAFRAETPHDTGLYRGGRGFGSVPDLDRDGRPELFWVDDDPYLIVYELVSGDTFERKAIIHLPTSGGFMYWGSVCGAPDIDHNGRTEGIVYAYDPDNSGMVLVYESPTDDSFELVWHTYLPGGLDEDQRVSVGDVDGDRELEILAIGDAVYIYKCRGIHQYELLWEHYTGTPTAGLYDLNGDGRDEVICTVLGYATEIFEWLPVGVEERVAEKLKQIEIQPSVVSSRGVVQVMDLPPSAEVEVVDASGRVVASGSSGASSFVLGTSDLKAGAYFIRIRVGNQAVVRKVLVVE